MEFGCGNGLLYAGNGAIGTRTSTTVDIFRMAGSGALDPIAGSPSQAGVGLNGSVVLLNPDRGLLFAADQGIRGAGGDTVTAFRVSGADLSPVPGSPFPIGSGGVPSGLATTRSGEFVLTANYAEAGGAIPSIAVFAVAPDGSLLAAPGSPFSVPGSSLTSLATFPPPRCLP
jgi:hypothetical protein